MSRGTGEETERPGEGSTMPGNITFGVPKDRFGGAGDVTGNPGPGMNVNEPGVSGTPSSPFHAPWARPDPSPGTTDPFQTSPKAIQIHPLALQTLGDFTSHWALDPYPRPGAYRTLPAPFALQNFPYALQNPLSLRAV